MINKYFDYFDSISFNQLKKYFQHYIVLNNNNENERAREIWRQQMLFAPLSSNFLFSSFTQTQCILFEASLVHIAKKALLRFWKSDR